MVKKAPGHIPLEVPKPPYQIKAHKDGYQSIPRIWIGKFLTTSKCAWSISEDNEFSSLRLILIFFLFVLFSLTGCNKMGGELT